MSQVNVWEIVNTLQVSLLPKRVGLVEWKYGQNPGKESDEQRSLEQTGGGEGTTSTDAPDQ